MNDHPAAASGTSLNRLALSATVHCMTGCSIGEVAGMVVGSAAGLTTGTSVVLSTALAFVFGYLLTMIPLLRADTPLRTALGLAFASDTASIAVMEVVDNVVMVFIPGAMSAGLGEPLFWGSLVVSLLLGGVAAYPVVRFLIARGRGHAVVHGHHHHDEAGTRG